jgi:hypothetical protein
MRMAMIDLRSLTAIALSASLMLPLGALPGAEASAKPKKARVHKHAPAAKPWRWRPADPAFDQHGRLYRPPPGLICPVDLGYGRWASCLWDN